nr:hypothetical protein [Desulfobulbaceae bacterium]
MKCRDRNIVRFLLLTGFLATLLSISAASASVIDAPHNESNKIGCGDCHTYSLWWTYSPAQSRSDYSLIADDLCNKCHGSGGYAPNKLSHSFETMDLMHKQSAGDWQTTCVDCHDPHLQGQLDWLTIEPSVVTDLYLATGKRGTATMSYDSASHSTTFDYVDADARPGWLDPALWSVKTDGTRGLILYINDPAGSSTFEVNSAVESLAIIPGTPSGTGTITVQGEIPDTFSPDAEFSLFYGQLLKQSILTPNTSVMSVKFFDSGIQYDSGLIGGPADPVSNPPEGICQVCHYYTRYHNYDRQRPDPEDIDYPDGARIAVIDHNSGTVCNECHPTAEGFKPINADHTFLSSAGTTCANCHLASEDFVVDTHNGTCGTCHTEAPQLISAVSTGTGNKWPSSPHASGNCYDCHDTDGPGPDDIAGDFSNHPKAFDSDNNPDNGFDGHDGQLIATYGCTNNCHFHAGKDIVAEIHTGESVPSDPCVKCHELTVVDQGTYSGTKLTAKGTYDGSGKLIGSAVSGQGDCEHCHSTIATYWRAHPKQYTHENQVTVTGTGLCFRCHWYDINNKPEDIIDSIHYTVNGSCDMCHGVDGALKSLTAINGPGDCTNCHTSSFALHDISRFVSFDHRTTGLVTPEPADADVHCMLCHNEGQNNPDSPYLILDVHSPLIIPPATLPANYNNCLAYCHDDQGYLIGSAVGHGFADLNGVPNTCSTCHPEELHNHPSHSELGMNGSVAPTDSCVSCHIGDRTVDIHSNDCLLCHEALFRQQHRDLRAGLPNPDTAGDMDGLLDCIECHTQLDTSFFSADSRIPGDKLGHSKDDDHLGKVEGNPGCMSCHDGDPLYSTHFGIGPCTGCHALSGVLIGSAAGMGTGKPAIGIENDCVTCHGTFDLHSSLPIEFSHSLEVSLTPSCGITGCHSEADLVLGIHDLNGCSTCHASTGELRAPAVPLGGDCQTCHTTYFDGHQHGTNSHEVIAGGDTSETISFGQQPCYNCHHDLSWSGIITIHNIDNSGNCATCHESTRTINVNPAYADIAEVILVGDANTPITCLDCHSNATGFDHYCGNGVVNNVGEQCDDGALNSDTSSDACRTN